jgi:hypothetical protein
MKLNPPSLKLWWMKGGLAQLARALAWHARGHRFDSDYLHKPQPTGAVFLFLKGQCFYVMPEFFAFILVGHLF